MEQARNTFLSSGARHTVRINLAPNLPRVMADPRRIVQVLNNLLSNAARYGSGVSAHPGVRRARRGPRGAIGDR